MEKTKINIQTIIKDLETTKKELKEGIINATLTKSGKENVANDLKEVIALAEQMKADLINNKKAE